MKLFLRRLMIPTVVSSLFLILLASPVMAGVEPVTVGGEAYPVNTAAILAPWIALAVVIAGVSVVLMRRRVQRRT